MPRAAARVQPQRCTATARMAADDEASSLTVNPGRDGLKKKVLFLSVSPLMRAMRSVTWARVCARVLVCAVKFRTTHPAEYPRRAAAHTS